MTPPTANESNAARPNRWDQLDGLRCLAVASVAWCHWAPQYQWHLPWGSGVQLFFALSGFLITGILLDVAPQAGTAGRGSRLQVWGRFYARRCLRIFPLFYAVLALAWVAGVPPILSTWKWHAAYLSNFYYFQKGDWGVPREPFRHFWSLAVEEQFYLVWPFLVLLLTRRWLLATLGSMVVLAPAFRILVFQGTHNLAMTHVLPVACLDALAIGGVFACLQRGPLRPGWDAPRVARWCGGVGLPVALGATVLGHWFHDGEALDSLGHTGLVLFYGALVYWTTQGWRGWLGWLLRCAPVNYLGKISYGLYVIHLFVPVATTALARRGGWDGVLAGSFPLQIALNTAVTVLLAAVSWQVWERPFNGLKRFFPYLRPAADTTGATHPNTPTTLRRDGVASNAG